MIEFDFRRRKERIALSHDSKFRNPWQSHLLRNSSLKLEKSLNNQICVPVSKCWNRSKSSSGSYQLFDTYIEQKGNDGKKDKIRVQELLVAEYETRWQYEIYCEDLELWYIVTNQRCASVIWWSVTRSILQKFVQGDFDELEVEGFLRKIYRNASDRISH